jgi:hypothetical protein
MNYDYYFYDFIIPAVLYLANTDVILFYSIWKNKYLSNISDGKEVLKRIAIFCIVLASQCKN